YSYVATEALNRQSKSYQELRQNAANYYAENAVAPKLEEILNKMFYEQPNDVYGRLSEYFEEFALTPNIVKISANKVMDGVGAGGLQCSVFAEVKNQPKVLSSLSMSLEKEISMLPLQQQHTTERGCMHISESISSKLNNVSLLQQTEVDLMLRDWIDDAEYDKFIGANQPTEEDDGHSRTPTPSSGRKKKTSSGKAKVGKVPEKPVPPKEPMEDRLKGCTAASAVSVAVLKAAANFLQKSGIAQQNVDNTVTMPTPAMVVLSGGKSAPGKLHMLKNVFAIAKPGLTISESISNLIKVYQNVGKGLSAKSVNFDKIKQISASGGYEPSYDKPEQPLDAILEAINTSGLVPGQDIFLGIECSAHEIFDYDKGKYEISTGTLKTADEFIDLLKDLVMRYPSLIMIIDPLRREDREQWTKLCEMVSEKCFIIGSDVIYGSMHSLNDNMLSARKSSGLVISTGSRVTCSDLARVVGDIRARECVTIMTSPVGDVCDDIFSDLAVGLGATFVRFGAPSRGENTSKINRFIEIERIINESKTSKINYLSKFEFPVIKPPPPAPVSDEENEIPAENSSPDQKKKK
uniref:Enolase 4 n=1 Tax=Ciona intestinalis TaxID=7719 RepID=F6V8G3_CIOIN